MEKKRSFILGMWLVMTACVIVGSLAPGGSSLMGLLGRLHINDKLQHFSAYLSLAILPVIGFQQRRHGFVAALSMFLLSVVLELGQRFSPGRSVELGDVLANGLGVCSGVLIALVLIRSSVVFRGVDI